MAQIKVYQTDLDVLGGVDNIRHTGIEITLDNGDVYHCRGDL